MVRTLAEEGAAVIAGARTADTLAGLDGVVSVNAFFQPDGLTIDYGVRRSG